MERAQELILVRSLGYLARHVCSAGYAKPSGCSCPAVKIQPLRFRKTGTKALHARKGKYTPQSNILATVHICNPVRRPAKRKLQVRVCKVLRSRRTGLHTELGGNQTRLINYERVAESPMKANLITPTLTTRRRSIPVTYQVL